MNSSSIQPLDKHLTITRHLFLGSTEDFFEALFIFLRKLVEGWFIILTFDCEEKLPLVSFWMSWVCFDHHQRVLLLLLVLFQLNIFVVIWSSMELLCFKIHSCKVLVLSSMLIVFPYSLLSVSIDTVLCTIPWWIYASVLVWML